MARDPTALSIQGPDSSGGNPVPTLLGVLGAGGNVRTQTHANGSGAASAFNVDFPAVAGVTNYVEGIYVSGFGSTGQAEPNVTISGIEGGPMVIGFAVPSGAATPITPVFINFPDPLKGAAPNTLVRMTVSSFGAGNTAATATMWGFTQ